MTAMKVLSTVWYAKLFSIQGQHVSVGTIVVGLIIILVGVVISKHFSLNISKRVLSRVGVPQGEADALSRLLFYVLVAVCTLLAIEIVGIPLTVFTLLGGALAIGVGFGSQNIMNNFISGLILLIERPIRVGDQIQVSGYQGRVDQIGLRSTRIQTGDNIDLVVPNSVLLEANVVNWTLSDERVRTSVSVGVDYGSDVALVKSLLCQAALSVEGVLPEPQPFAVLNDFGNSALMFQVFFWINLRHSKSRLILESDVRCEVESILRKHNISIPYPRMVVTHAA